MYGGQDRDMNEGPPAKRFQRDDNADPINPDPSIVVHVRNLSHKASEADLLEALSTFGPIAYAFVKRNHQMALVEFESLEGARACVEFAAGSQIYVAGQPAHFNYSTSQSIQRMGHECSTPNHVLVLTISNVQYPISVDVLHEICSPHGEVQRIRIVKRTHVITALVEFPSVEIAKATKHAINGADIYSGCCTLKVEFAGADHVRITRDEPDQRDFTLPPPEACAPPQRKTLMPAPDAVGAPPSYGGSPAPPPPGYPPVAGNGYPPVAGSRGGAPPTAPAYPAQRGYPPAAGDPYAADPYARNPYGYEAPEGYPPAVDPYAAPPRDPYGYGGGPAAGYHGEEGGGGETPGNVLMVYGLDQSKINCDMIFNIFCQYGDVLRIKFMRAKVDTAMVEMGSHEQVENALNYLQGVVFFGMTIELKPSFQVGVREVREPFDMPDGTPSFRDFSASRNLRFATPELATRNRMMYPSCVLHWYNSPPEMDEEKIKELFAERKAPAPISTFKFPAKSERSSSGTAEFESVEKANEALALANHTPVVSPAGKAPYIVKMSYTHSRSTSRYAEGSHSGEDHEGGDGGPSSSSRGGYRGRGRGRGDSRGRGGYRGGRGDFRGRGRGRGDYGGGGYGAPRDRYFN